MGKSSLSLEGLTLRTNNGDVILGGLLGEGATAFVYRAKLKDNDVVVKLSKPGENARIDDEWHVLENVQEEYRKKNQPTPIVYDRGTFREQSFIVMEYLRGLSALEAIQEKGNLQEMEVLSLSVEFFHFMDFLHSKCKRTYPDLKFDDFRLEKGEDGLLRLRLFDFGGLPNMDDERARPERDIIVVASMLFALLRGYTLQLLGGEITEDVEQKVKINSDDHGLGDQVSWGTRRYFGHLLSRAPEFRMNSARDAEAAAKELLELWTLEDQGALFEKVAKFSKLAEQVRTGDPEMRNEYLAKARMGFEVYRRRYPASESDTFSAQAARFYEGTSYLENGKIDLKHGLYIPAIRKFRAGETLENKQKTSEFRRWRYLAQALEQGGDELSFETAERISDLFAAKRYSEVLKQVELFPPAIERDSIRIEADIYSAYEAGFKHKEDGRYEEAMREFEKIHSSLNMIPMEDQGSIKRDGNPQKLIDECKSLMVEREQKKQYLGLAKELEEKFSRGQFPRDEMRRFVVLGKNQEDISVRVEQLLAAALYGKGDVANVFHAAESLFWGIPEKTGNIRKAYETCSDLAAVQSFIDMGLDDEDALRLIEGLIEQSNKNPSIAGRVADLLQNMVASGYAGGNLEYWKRMQGLSSKKLNRAETGSGQARKIAESISQQIKVNQERQKDEKKINISRMDQLLDKGKLQPVQLMLFAQSFSRFDSGKFMIKLDNQKKAVGGVVRQAGTRASTENFQSRWANVAGLKFDGSQPDQQKDLFYLLSDCLESLWYEESRKEEVLEIVSQCFAKIGGTGLRGWNALSKYLVKEMEKLHKSKQDFEEGKLDKAFSVLQSLPTGKLILCDGLSLCARVYQTQQFENWAEHHKHNLKNVGNAEVAKELEEDIETFTSKGIPITYLNKLRSFLDKRKRHDIIMKLNLPDAPQQRVSGRHITRSQLVWGATAVFLMIAMAGVFMFSKPAALAPATPTSTSTAVPTQTLSPTPTLTAVLTLAFTPTLEPLTQSQFLIPDVSAIEPRLPVRAVSAWHIPTFDRCSDTDINLCAKMDQPVAAGSYALFIYNDVQQNLEPRPLMNVLLSVNETNSDVPPILGLGQFQIGTYREVSRFNPWPVVWVWAGNYELNKKGTIAVKISSVDPVKEIAAMDLERVILVRLDEAQGVGFPLVGDAYELVQFLDDTNLQTGENDLKSASLTPPALLDSVVWNDTIQYVEKAVFKGSGVLQAGTYKAYYHMVGEGIPPVTMNLKVATAASQEVLTETKDFALPSIAEWVPIGDDFELKVAAQIAFWIDSNVRGSAIPVDAILIYMKK